MKKKDAKIYKKDAKIYNGGQKRKKRERPAKFAPDMQKDLAARKTHFHSLYIHNAF